MDIDDIPNRLPQSIVPPQMKLFTRLFKKKANTSERTESPTPSGNSKLNLVGHSSNNMVKLATGRNTISLSKPLQLSIRRIEVKDRLEQQPSLTAVKKPRISRKLSISKGTASISPEKSLNEAQDSFSVEEGPGRRQTVILAKCQPNFMKNRAGSFCTTYTSQSKSGVLDVNPSLRFIMRPAEASTKSVVISQGQYTCNPNIVEGRIKFTRVGKIQPTPSKTESTQAATPTQHGSMKPSLAFECFGRVEMVSPQNAMSVKQPATKNAIDPPQATATRRPQRFSASPARKRRNHKWIDPGSREQDIIIDFQRDL